MKKLILAAASAVGFVLSLVGCVAAIDPTTTTTTTTTTTVAPKTAFTWTATDFYLVGTINTTAIWDNNTAGTGTVVNQMTKLSDAVYERTVALTAGTWSFQMADSTWGVFNGNSDITTGTAGGTLKQGGMAPAFVTITTAGNYTFHFDLANQTVAVVPAMYLVGELAGDGTAVWTTTDTNVALYCGNGVYEKTVTITSVGAAISGGLDFQIANSAWTVAKTASTAVPADGIDATLISGGMGVTNAKATVATAGNYTIRFDTVNNTVALTPAYYLVGKILSWDAGDWNVGTLPNLMVYDGSNSYSKVIKVTKGTATTDPGFQFATSSWSPAWTSTAALTVGTAGTLVAAGMANQTVGITDTGCYLVTFNPVALTVKFTALP